MEGDAPRGGARGPVSSSQSGLLSRACQLLGERRQLELDAEDKRTLRDGLADALAVLYPGSAQRRLQLVTAKPCVAQDRPAQDALAQVWHGVVTVAAAWDHYDSVEAFVEGVMDHCAQVAGIRLMTVALGSGDEEEQEGSEGATAHSSLSSPRDVSGIPTPPE